jgi:hypothetical protein
MHRQVHFGGDWTLRSLYSPTSRVVGPLWIWASGPAGWPAPLPGRRSWVFGASGTGRSLPAGGGEASPCVAVSGTGSVLAVCGWREWS